MAHPHRPRTVIEALFESPFVGSDNGDRGIGPTLGENVGEPPLPSVRSRPEPKIPEPKVFAAKPRPVKPAKPRSPEDKPDDNP